MHQIRMFDRKVVEWTERHRVASKIILYSITAVVGFTIGLVASYYVIITFMI